MDSTTTIEKDQLLLKLAKDYSDKGYEPSLHPSTETLPDFLKSYRPDMIVRRGEESIVILIQSRISLNSSSSRLAELAQVIKNEPGWKFDLVMSNSEDAAYALKAEGSLQPNEIYAGLQMLDLLINHSLESAILYAWSLSEAVLRLVVEKEGLRSKRSDPPYLVKQLATEGMISRDEYQVLMNAMALRNAIAHGFKTSQLTPDVVFQLIEITKQLLETLR
jgi:uncharacterized protein YutE (UPF0331/DUF86 family)